MIRRKDLKLILPFIGGLIIYTYFKDPTSGPILPCLFNKITGFLCPGCGMTRAVNSILHFNFKEAWRYNILVYIIPISLLIYFYIRNYSKKNSNIFLLLVLIFVIIFGIIRNLPYFNFY